TGPAAMLAALKPRGNPLACGRPGPPRREDGVTVRLRDAGRPASWSPDDGRSAAGPPVAAGPDAGGPGAGGPSAGGPGAGGPGAGGPGAGSPVAASAARVRLFTAPGTARLTSLLEDADGPALPLVDGAAEVAVPAAGTVTLALAGFGAGPT